MPTIAEDYERLMLETEQLRLHFKNRNVPMHIAVAAIAASARYLLYES